MVSRSNAVSERLTTIKLAQNFGSRYFGWFPSEIPKLDTISVRGARTHNLRNIDLEIPRDKLVIITGLRALACTARQAAMADDEVGEVLDAIRTL